MADKKMVFTECKVSVWIDATMRTNGTYVIRIEDERGVLFDQAFVTDWDTDRDFLITLTNRLREKGLLRAA